MTTTHGWTFLGRIALIPAACLWLACAAGTPDAPPPADRLPAGFDEQALLALVGNLHVIKTIDNEIDVEVLQWKVEGDDRQQTLSALIWVRFVAGEREDWMLAHVIRATGPDGPTSPWSLAVWKDTPQVSHQYYEAPPGPSDVTRFRRASWWSDEPTAGKRVLDAAVRAAAWTAAIGAPPPDAGG